MDRATVLARVLDEERRVAISWCGAAAEADPADAIRDVLRREAAVDHAEVEIQFTMDDAHVQRVLVALCHRYGLQPYRRPRQRRSTMMLSGPEKFVKELFWPLAHKCTGIVGDEVTAWVGELVAELSTPSP